MNEIQRDRGVEAAFQRDFNQVLAISEKQINQKADDMVEDVRSQFPGAGTACVETLDRMLATHPHLAHVFVYTPSGGLTLRSQPSRLKDPIVFRAEADDLASMTNSWMQVEYKDEVKSIEEMSKKGKPFYFFHQTGLREARKRCINRAQCSLVSDAWGERKAVGGMVFDAEYLRDQFFPEKLDTILSHQDERGEKNRVAMMVHARHDSTPLAASSRWDGGEPEVERNMEGAFPNLTLAIKLPGTTLAAMGQHFVRTSFLTLITISLLLAGGIILTHRNISREMALAKLKSDFVSNVSHELRTPLSLIRLYAETLEMGRLKTADKYQEYYSIIRKESERLTALINNILDFSRIEAGRKEYDFRQTDMRELVRNTLESYRYQIEQSGFAFEEKIAEDVPPISVDREAMARSLLKLWLQQCPEIFARPEIYRSESLP